MNKVSKKQRGQSRNGQNQYEDVVDEIKIELLDVKEVCITVLGNKNETLVSIQFLKISIVPLVNKLYVYEVTFRGQNSPLKCYS